MQSPDKNMEVFQEITTMIQSPQFGENQWDFFERNCGEFEDDAEENRLEHTNIHQEYVHMLD